MSIFTSIAKNPVVANLLLLLLFVLGISGAVQMNRELFPLFSFDRIAVTLAYPGASPREVERGAVRKIEDAIHGISRIKEIISTSSEGSGSIIISIDKGGNIAAVKDEVDSAIGRLTSLPREMEEPFVKEMVRDEELIFLSLAGRNSSERVLKKLADEMKEEILSIKGISKVVVGGVRDYEISIEVSEEALSKYNLTIDQIAQKVKSESEDASGGKLKTAQGEILLRGVAEKDSGWKYENIVILKEYDGTAVRLKDIATINDGFEDTELKAYYGETPSALIQVFRSSSADSITASEKIYDYMEKKQLEIPEGFTLVPWFDTSVHIEERIKLLLKNGIQGIIFVFFALWLFLEFRLSLWVMMGIPASFGGGLFLMYLSGQSINMISLFTLIMALGILVDDAIVVGENIHAHLKQGKSRLTAAIDGTKEVAIPVIGSVTTTIVAFIPMLLMTGVFGKFMSVIPYAMIACLITSLFECFFILPAHLANSKFKKISEGTVRFRIEATIEGFIQKIYLPVFRVVVSYRYVSLSAAIALLVLTGVSVKANLVKTVVFPAVDQYIVDASFEFPEGTHFEHSDEAARHIRSKVSGLNNYFKNRVNSDKPLVKHVFSFVGRTEGPNRAEGSHLGMVILELISSEEREVRSNEVIRKWRELVGEISGVKKIVFGRAFRHGPGGTDIEINLTGEDLNELSVASLAVQEKLKLKEHVSDVTDNFKEGKKELQFRLKDEAGTLNIDQKKLATWIRDAYYGREVLRLQRSGSEMKVVVRLKRDEREDLSRLEQRVFATDDGDLPFSELADINFTSGFSSIFKEDRKISLYISAEVDPEGNAGIILSDFVKDELKPVLEKFPGVKYSLKGQAEQRSESFGSLFRAYGTVSLPLIFIILAAIFKSYIQPAIIMCTIPFGIIGAVAGHYLLGHDMSLFSMIGIVALSGIVINDALVMIDFVNRSFRKGTPLMIALEESGQKRFRAILLTSLTTVAGLLPLLFEKSVQAQILIPMAISISFGLIMATFLTLFFVPLMYYILIDIKRVSHWAWTGRWAL